MMLKNEVTILAIVFLISASFYGQESNKKTLEQGFKNRPASAKPQTWMHALDGNMYKEGLTKDLEAIADVGIGGVLLFNIAYKIPKGKILYNSEEHRALLKHAAVESERLGLTFGIHNCDGWTSSGGPWVKPEQSMKMIVYRDTVVKGGKVNLKLPIPTIRQGYYKDITVLANPSLLSEIADTQNKYTICTGKGEFDLEAHNEGSTAKFIRLKVPMKLGIEKISFSSTQVITDRLARISMAREIASKLDPIGAPKKEMIIDRCKIINLSDRLYY